MISIIKAQSKSAGLLAELAKNTFLESHGTSAAAADIDAHINTRYNISVLSNELKDVRNIYHLIYYQFQLAGYSKIIPDEAYSSSNISNTTKLERLYIQKKYYSLQLGFQLLQFNVNLAKTMGQAGIWLFVWKENHRAVEFYKRNGFEIVGSHDFKISETHTNPNHQMLLTF